MFCGLRGAGWGLAAAGTDAQPPSQVTAAVRSSVPRVPSLCPQFTALMPKGRRKGPHSDAPLGLPTCRWLGLAGLFLLVPWVTGWAATGGPGAQGPGGLSWAVHLDNLEDRKQDETLEQQAEALAWAAGLVNAGRIGQLRGHYLFVQPAGPRLEQQVEAVRQRAEAVLAGHDAVRWHSEQRPLKRAKRSVHFNDPKYPLQWHLVSQAPLPPAPDGQLCAPGSPGPSARLLPGAPVLCLKRRFSGHRWRSYLACASLCSLLGSPGAQWSGDRCWATH